MDRMFGTQFRTCFKTCAVFRYICKIVITLHGNKMKIITAQQAKLYNNLQN